MVSFTPGTYLEGFKIPLIVEADSLSQYKIMREELNKRKITFVCGVRR